MKAIATANYLLYIMSDAFADFGNIKFGQGYYPKKYGRPFFDNAIEVWNQGPIVPEVYYTYKKYCDKLIKGYDNNMIDEITPETEDILFNIAQKYGRFTAGALQNMIYTVGNQWTQVYRLHTEIPLIAIQYYFAKAEALILAKTVSLLKDHSINNSNAVQICRFMLI